MADLVLQALLGLLRGECSRAPLVLVLEDLQWCDSLTVKVLGAALTQLLDAPLCVLALARPELHATFSSSVARPGAGHSPATAVAQGSRALGAAVPGAGGQPDPRSRALSSKPMEIRCGWRN